MHKKKRMINPEEQKQKHDWKEICTVIAAIVYLITEIIKKL